MRFYVYGAIRAFQSLGDSLLQLGSAIGELTLYCYTSLGYWLEPRVVGCRESGLRTWVWAHRVVGLNADSHLLSCCGTAVLAGESGTAGGSE